LIDINELKTRDGPLLIEKNFSEGELDMASDISMLRQPVHSQLQLSLVGEQIHVKGVVGANLELTCSRCLKSFERSIEKNFELDYRPDPMVEEEGEEFSLAYTDLDVGFYRDQKLDVSALVAEQVVLEVPMKPVCHGDCKGLCDQCGADLNEKGCDCQPGSLDPRLAVLADLKKKISES